jgi:uncharacterized peroxidase-related enzyme
MSFLPSLGRDATLPELFKAYPATARKLLPFEEEVMRGPSPLSVARRELIAAYVSGLNSCGHCYGVHAATAEAFGVADGVLESLIGDVDSAPVEERMKPILRFARKLTRTPDRMVAGDVEEILAAGWDEKAVHDAALVCALFNCMNRIVSGAGIVGTEPYYKAGGAALAKDGYAAIADKLGL